MKIHRLVAFALFGAILSLGGVQFSFADHRPGHEPGGGGGLPDESGVDTNAATLCEAGEYLDGDGTCYDIPVDTNTNAATLCGSGQFLDGDGNCLTPTEGVRTGCPYADEIAHLLTVPGMGEFDKYDDAFYCSFSDRNSAGSGGDNLFEIALSATSGLDAWGYWTFQHRPLINTSFWLDAWPYGRPSLVKVNDTLTFGQAMACAAIVKERGFCLLLEHPLNP